MADYIDSFKVDNTEYDLRDRAAVRYDEAQSLTDAQKTQARENIGAGAGTGAYYINYGENIDYSELFNIHYYKKIPIVCRVDWGTETHDAFLTEFNDNACYLTFSAGEKTFQVDASSTWTSYAAKAAYALYNSQTTLALRNMGFQTSDTTPTENHAIYWTYG